jgi:alpha-D-xyloside xylohydrolase
MIKKWYYLIFFLFSFFIARADGPGKFIKTGDGIIVYPDPSLAANVQSVHLEVVADNIIRVLVMPDNAMTYSESLITIYDKSAALSWKVDSTNESVALKTKQLTAIVQLKTGAVSFYDAAGKRILNEKLPAGRLVTPTVFEGKRSYSFVQSFQTTEDDSYYGLGQHQDDIFNYKGQQVNLFQNNTEVAIPFLISSKNYGILWDNYSLTSIGNITPFQPLSAFQLFSKNGEEGWLTASYFNDKNDRSRNVVQRAETSIDMEYVNESKQKLPPAFTPNKGLVTWEGSVASSFTGVHKMRLTYGGYVRVWVKGKLILDRWRKAWNPAPALLDITLEKNEKYALKIEWIPDGTESYLSVKWQEPETDVNRNSFSFSSEAGQKLDYYFVYGNNMDEVIAGYRTLTGKATLVPRWALGFWQSRERYKTQEEVLSTVAEFRKRRIPIDNIVLDWFYWKEAEWGSQEFDPARFPSPDSMISLLHNKYHTQLMISVWPKFYEGIPNYDAFNKKGWLYKRNIVDRQKDWVGPGYTSTFYDAFNEEARKGFWDLIRKKIYSKGIDAWWMDSSEPDILSNVSPERRKEQMTPVAIGPVAENLNAYPLQNAKGIYEGQRSTDPNKRVFLLTRSGFAGSQRYAAAIWSGDIGARWHDMKAQIPAGINFSLSGLPYWTMDIGGFVVENRFESPNARDLEEWRELMTRWFQFGAFIPLFRSHGQFPNREIFNTAPETHHAYKSMLYYNKLRYRLLPYIYSLAGKTYHDDYTIMRALVMDFPDDKKVHSIGDQYMFGPSLLINPVYEYQAKKRTLYLPSCGWYDLYTGKYEKGGKTINADAPYERIPIFVKEGSVIPFGPELQYVSEKKADTILLHVYEGGNGSFTLYEDEGTNYDYEKKAFSNIKFAYEDQTRSLVIQNREGEYSGMLKDRVFIIKYIRKQLAQNLDLDSKNGILVKYNGERKVISLK